jgi:hypothetical protein
MSDPVTLKQQVAFIQGTLDTHEQVCGVKVEMGRMTKADAQRRTDKLKAVLATLKKAEAAGGVAESALKEMAPAAKSDVAPDLTVIVHEIHRCAREHMDKCEHCAAIAHILEESGSKV